MANIITHSQSLVESNLEDVVTHLATTAVVARQKRAHLRPKFAAEGDEGSVVGNALTAGKNWLSDKWTGLDPATRQSLRWGLAGAGTGAALGAGSQLFVDEKKRRPLSSLMQGALLGGTAGLGSSLVYRNMLGGSAGGGGGGAGGAGGGAGGRKGVFSFFDSPITSDADAARKALIHEQAGTINPQMQARANDWGVDSGRLSELGSMTNRFSPEEANKTFIEQMRYKPQDGTGYSFRLPANMQHLTANLKPSADGNYLWADQDPAQLPAVVKAMQDSVRNNSLSNQVGRNLTSIGQHFSGKHMGAATSDGGISEGFRRSPFGLFGVQNLFDNGDREKGFIPELARVFGRNNLNTFKGDDPTFAPIRAAGFNPTEVMEAGANGQEGLKNLAQRMITERRMNPLATGGAAPWGNEEDLLANLSAQYKKMNDDTGRSSVLNYLSGLTTGNTTADFVAPVAGADIYGTAKKYLNDRNIANPKSTASFTSHNLASSLNNLPGWLPDEAKKYISAVQAELGQDGMDKLIAGGRPRVNAVPTPVLHQDALRRLAREAVLARQAASAPKSFLGHLPKLLGGGWAGTRIPRALPYGAAFIGPEWVLHNGAPPRSQIEARLNQP